VLPTKGRQVSEKVVGNAKAAEVQASRLLRNALSAWIGGRLLTK